jgi:methylmalonyl-CoA epimerase
MMFQLDHIGIVVEALDQAVPRWCSILGFPMESVEFHDVPSEGVRIAMLRGNIKLELLEATDPSGSVQRFLEKRGAGLHHLCFSTDDADRTYDRLNEAGMQLLSAAPVNGAEGRVFFIHPKSASGVLAEMVELHEAD